ncbi:MAG: 50S ribosomal protein L3 [Simkaniaceae bacterium]
MNLKLMGKKVGMTQVYDPSGNLIVCTVILVEPNVVTQVKTLEKDGYQAIQLGAFKLKSSRKKNMTKPLAGHFSSQKLEPREFIIESRVESLENFEIGQEIGVEAFAECTFVDVVGRSKGKGFQGVMKRHNFKGGPAAHGSGFHRSAGSTGCRSTPGRNFPGGKKAGHMGDERVTQEGLKVIKADSEKRVLFVKGAVPGCKNGLVYIRKSLKKEQLAKGRS